MPKAKHLLLLSTLVLLTWPVAACKDSSGPKLYKVRGKVLYKDEPAAGAVVFFHRKDRIDRTGPVPRGETDKEGRFSLTTRDQDDGALAGEYVVTIYWPDPNVPSGEGGQRPDLLEGAYGDANTSPLTAEVQAKSNDLPPFELK